MRASLVQRYLGVVTRDVRRLRRDIEHWHAASPANESADRPIALAVGTIVGMEHPVEPGSELHRELRAVSSFEHRLKFLTHSSSDLGRIYYRSSRGPVYVTPSVPSGLGDAFRDFAAHPLEDTSARWIVRRADMFDLDDTQTSLWILSPVSFDGATRGVLAARVKLDKVRPLLAEGNSVGEFYLTNKDGPVRLESRIAHRYNRAAIGDRAEDAEPAPPYPAAVGANLRIAHRYPAGEPYLAAARASFAPWLILAVAAGMTGWIVHRMLRSELVERRRAESGLRDACGRQQKLAARLRSLANELTNVQHRERKRLASLLHDDLQQLLVATRIKLGRAKQHDCDIEEADRLISQAIEASRDLTQQLYPPALYEAGLVPALRSLAEQMRHRYSLEVSVDATRSDRLDGLCEHVNTVLYEAVRELVFNAVKHADANRAKIRLRPTSSYLQISVLDWGKGFDTGACNQSADKSGFGLFSVEERLIAIGGEMSIHSEVGRGTSVRLSVPLEGASKGMEEDRDTCSPTPAGPEVDDLPEPCPDTVDARPRVLIVDDHAVVRQSIANVLDADPRLAVVGLASDGAEAIGAIEQCRPEIVLMDVDMPDMSGIEATARIHYRWPSIAIFGLSVKDDVAVAEAMLEAGATSLLSKSLELDAMIAHVSGQPDASAEQAAG